MPATVVVNKLTLAHKGTGGFARSTLPDVCKTPSVPVPYVNISFISTLTKGTKTVIADGYMIAILGSEQSTSIGDEPGVGKGVKSGTQLDRATWISWSPNVFMEGRPVNRLTDKMLMNNGNTVCLAGHWDPPKFKDDPIGKELCKQACECVISEKAKKASGENTGRMKPDDCFSDAIEAQKDKPIQTGNGPVNLLSNGVYTKAVDEEGNITWTLQAGRNRPKGSCSPDITCLDPTTGNPGNVYELKFGKDRLRKDQGQRNDQVADSNGGKATTIKVDKDCDCDDYEKEKKEKEAKETSAAAQKAVGAAVLKLIARKAITAVVTDGASVIVDVFDSVFTSSPAY